VSALKLTSAAAKTPFDKTITWEDAANPFGKASDFFENKCGFDKCDITSCTIKNKDCKTDVTDKKLQVTGANFDLSFAKAAVGDAGLAKIDRCYSCSNGEQTIDYSIQVAQSYRCIGKIASTRNSQDAFLNKPILTAEMPFSKITESKYLIHPKDYWSVSTECPFIKCEILYKNKMKFDAYTKYIGDNVAVAQDYRTQMWTITPNQGVALGQVKQDYKLKCYDNKESNKYEALFSL